ncbi:MAG: transporter substrate-binding domain-containing protein [Chromatiaceae bacterium]|nr:transporter substrate-binding domain-containing protein [Gammaproteobacteria bacterium]MCP5300477.1 transporter substrate-binding domain-containing protein [Chromatiaceae bacterium]MCP5422549.1 transporter substrate-binding domain-containing protein [Chromatiaceae bacterium]
MYQSILRTLLAPCLALIFCVGSAVAHDLDEVRAAGVLRHLGIPYANFVTGAGDGLDVELMKGFADHLGVRYEFVPTSWDKVFGDLTGQNARRNGDHAERFGDGPIRGDLVANGMTVLGWRQQVVAFSQPTFPSGVWLLARAESALTPIQPSGALDADIVETKSRLDGNSVLALANTCLDPGLYRLESTRADIRLAPKERKLNEMVPALLNRDAETTLLDVPDALIALERWPGQIKVLGPISDEQRMAVAFRPDTPKLRAAFNAYLQQVRSDGTYQRLVRKYYPAVFDYFPEFFASN